MHDGKPIFYSLGDFFLQLEQIVRFPIGTYRHFGVYEEQALALFEHWFFENGHSWDEIVGDGPVWEIVLPACTFESRGGGSTGSNCCPAGFRRVAGRAGNPGGCERRSAKAVLDQFDSVSTALDTTIERSREVGVVEG